MHITFTSASIQNPQFLTVNAGNFENEQFTERLSAMDLPHGKFHLQQTWFPGACLLVSTIDIKKSAGITISCDDMCWLMNFMLGGELNIRLRPDEKDLKLQQGRYHTFYSSSLNAAISLKQNCRLLTICLTKDFIKKLLGTFTLPRHFESNPQEVFMLIAKGWYLNTPLSLPVNDVLNADQPVYIKRIFLEAKILEILSLQLNQLEARQPQTDQFSADDKIRLLEAKTIVEQNLKSPCSLTELSRKTGLNDFKLKKGFKALFGNTVFGYLGELRMTTAYKLLKNGERVSTVAENVGYKNPHHFTVAFKKRYNMLPSQVIG
jgi:AraC-like DNA-binding protein